MKVVWILLTLSCDGHTNAVCSPEMQMFQTKQECLAAGDKYHKETYGLKQKGVCFQTITTERPR